MKCPTCNVDLLMGERMTVSIDYCPQCRGIWLEKGKLDQLLDLAQKQQPPPVMQRPDQMRMNESYNSNSHHDHHNDDYEKQHKKKGGFLGELFD